MLMTRMLFSHLKIDAYLRRIFSRLWLLRCRYGLDRSGAGRRSHGINSLFNIFLGHMVLLWEDKRRMSGLFFFFSLSFENLNATLMNFHPPSNKCFVLRGVRSTLFRRGSVITSVKIRTKSGRSTA